MLRNGNSCDLSPESDDLTKKLLRLSSAGETAEIPSFKSESYGVPITFSSPKSREDLFDFMVAAIQAKDLRTCSTLVICQQNDEARVVKSEIGKHNINTILLDGDLLTNQHMVRLWSEGYIQQVLIACDDHLKLLEGIPINFVIHTALPPVEKFQVRLNSLTKLKNNAEMLAFILGGPKEEIWSLKAQSVEENNVKIPNLVVKQLNKNPKGKNSDMAWISRALDRPKRYVEDSEIPGNTRALNGENGSMEGSEIPKNTRAPNGENGSMKDSEIPGNTRALNGENRSMEGSEKPKNNRAPNGENGSMKDSEIPGNTRALNGENGSMEGSEIPGNTRALNGENESKESPEESDIEGWETPPEDPTDYDDTQREMEVFFDARDQLDIESPPPPPSPNASSFDSAAATKGQSSDAVSEGEGMTQTQFGVLAWSRDLIVSCYDIGSVLALNPLIRDTMMTLIEDMKDRQARGIQRYAWPHVSCGKSLVVVGPENIGKTWCCLPSLCQRTHEQMLLRSKGQYGPTSIVVCFSPQKGMQILDWITQLLGRLCTAAPTPCQQVVTLWDKSNAQEVADRLRRQPFGILLTTPDMLVLLRDLQIKKSPIFDGKSIKCLALNNLSAMMRHLPETTAKMFDWIIQLLDFGVDGCQLFVTTRLWPETLMRESLLSRVPDVLVVFKDPLEATIFGKASLEVKLIGPGEESNSLVEMLRDRNLSEERIVVMCHNKEEVVEIKSQLTRANIRAEGIYAEGGLSTASQWRLRKLALVLLISDDIVNKVKCGRVDQLIHLNSSISWMRFKFRFSLLYNNYLAPAEGSPGKSVVLLQQTDYDRIWLLSDFMMWHQLHRPDDWLRILAESRLRREKHSSVIAKLSLCEHISRYGDCFRRTCRYRHVMWKEEVQPPANYPTEGDFRFQVLTCNSPAHIAVRLNELYPTKVTLHNTPMSELCHQLHVYYNQKENQRPHPEPKIGEVVILRNMQRYERAIITGKDNSKLIVRLLDTGIEVLTYKPKQIFICEERHQNEPCQATEVCLLGIEPATLERIWTKDMRDVVRNGFFKRPGEKRTRIFSARVKFVMSRRIFVETVVDDKGQDLRSYLLDRFRVYEDVMSMEKLMGVVDAAQPCPKDE